MNHRIQVKVVLRFPSGSEDLNKTSLRFPIKLVRRDSLRAIARWMCGVVHGVE